MLITVFHLLLQDPIYLPASSELDVQIWRLTDNTKKRVWFEWSAQAYLAITAPLSGPGGALGGLASPTSATFSTSSGVGGGRAGALSPVLGGSEAAFASAPSPMLGSNEGGRMSAILEEGQGQEQGAAGATVNRIKISQTRLHNPGGKTSWIGL